MKHARDDYNRIQDPEGKIPEDEPVFLIRGQDLAGPNTLEFWANQVLQAGGDHKIVIAALGQADRMRRWQDKNGKKVPDMPAGPETGDFSATLDRRNKVAKEAIDSLSHLSGPDALAIVMSWMSLDAIEAMMTAWKKS